MKKSFVLYTDYLEQMELLSMEQRGLLFTAIMNYAAEKELPEMDGVTAMCFAFVKAQLDRDDEKYKAICEQRSEAGKLGGRPRKAEGFSEKQTKAKKASAFSKKQNKARKADNEYDDEYEAGYDYESEENDIPPKSPQRGKEATVYFPNDTKLDQAFRDYIAMRKQMKKPMTDRAIALAMKKLQELSADSFSGTMNNDIAIQILEQSILNGWQGLFPLKKDDGGAKRTNGGIDWAKV